MVINKVVCTTTLMQGVNLPAKNIITRNPNLFIKAKSAGDNPKLTGYEFSNLRGRAGRLMNDFVGRSIVLDEPAFEDA
ncbi:replicative superfamily II helicase [Salirhabdus euzebyi]|uniref:Replicative superfamily II helicase n=1 Tax=Salirhabdus euzebyi TaxID=394506 RepID=A0A841Q9F1_9BACI|nr:replicative superfamily II helicase [Salirhabdus euzebyi]